MGLTPEPNKDEEVVGDLSFDPKGMLDADDGAVLTRLAQLVDAVDPVPSDLVERSLFAITLAGLEADLMEAAYLDAPLAGVRGAAAAARADDTAPAEAKTITFTHDSLTVMISLSPSTGGRVRIDGWAAPAAGLDVELHRPGADVVTVASDEDGRFSFDSVERGRASLVVRRTDGGGGAVSTPVIEL
ncbi:hypothetical protein [Promicromonospora iranensis]|uniref:Carboxypeptidase regulatory-like domain-containing protein n=1 Tax=Promicromonospora iranensis TaxID=1105144 RepID=A0ABU2CMR9_9MICO|nr:hypothetical protein [Promicromonospora iranensis]MDR7382591.1 hypothetical protein [Promicromonospora iranensis]